MEKEKLLIEILQKTSDNLPSAVKRNDYVLGKIPFNTLASTGIISQEEYEEYKDIIKEFQLDDPKKLVKWVIDLHFAGIESINDNITNVRRDLLSNELSQIRAIKRKITNLSDSDDNKEKLKDEIIDVTSNLEVKVQDYLKEIIRIDDLPRYKFFLQANFNKSKVTASVQLSKVALQAYFEALNIYAVLSNERTKASARDSTFDEYIEFINELDLSYFIAYDKDKSTFWNKKDMLQKIEDARKIKALLNDYISAEQETEIDFENDLDFSC